MLDDEQLLERLSDALRPTDTIPDTVQIAALHRAVQAHRHESPRPAGFWTGFRRGFQRPLVVFLVGTAVVSGGTAMAVGSGATLPRPLRSAANAIGLPVDSVAVAATRHTMSELESALEAGDRAEVRSDADRLRQQLVDLSEPDRANVAGEAAILLAQADAFLAATGPAADEGAAGSDDDQSGRGADDTVNGADDPGDTSGRDPSSTDGSGSGGSGSGSGDGGSGSSGSSGSGSSGSGSSGGGGDDNAGSGSDDSGSDDTGSGDSGSGDSGSDSGSQDSGSLDSGSGDSG